MYAGQRASYNGYEYCLFPLDVLNCTQTSAPDSLSHCCGHPADYTGPYDNYPYYAPFTCTRIWTYPSSGETIYVSDNPVWTPSGLSYVSILFAHDDNIPSQTHFTQGDLIGHTGTTGFALGDHVHMDQSLHQNDSLVNYGITCRGGNICWALQYSAYPYAVFYLGGTEQIINTQGMQFQTVPSGPQPPTGDAPLALFPYILKKRRLRHAKRITGSL